MKKLWIAGYPWDVNFTTKTLYDKGKEVFGTCDGNKMLIEIAAACDIKERSTGFHELAHGALNTVINGYPDEEEACVQGLEAGIFPCLIDERNDWFWDWVRGCKTTRRKRRVKDGIHNTGK